MKVVYIAGPYRANTVHGILENIRRAEALAIEVWKTGHVALCPHMNSAFFDGLASDETFLQGTLELLSRCDALVPVREHAHSKGTQAEIEFCHAHGIPVFENPQALAAYQWTTFKDIWYCEVHGGVRHLLGENGLPCCPYCGTETTPF